MRPLAQILDEFLTACLVAEDAQNRGDSKTYNKQYRIKMKIRSDLKANPTYGLDKLLPFLEHENDYVRLAAAAHVMCIAAPKARKVLEELSKKRGIDAFNASMFLSEWDKGNISNLC